MSYTIDLQKIADKLDFDLEDIEMLLEVFIESAKESLEILKDAIDINNMEAISSSAHAIKGSAANLTLNEISDIAKEMEHNAREKNSIDYLSHYEKLNLLLKDIED
jgi:HPt (histidine-containing phosphotransfer) domain-containing protein